MIYEQNTTSTQFIVQLTTVELELMLRKVVADALQVNIPKARRDQEPDEPLLSIDELCRKLQVSRDLIYRLRKNGKLPSYQVGKRKFFKLSEVLQELKTKSL